MPEQYCLPSPEKVTTWKYESPRLGHFVVNVIHYTVPTLRDEEDPHQLGPNRWNVHVYLYPKHPRFNSADLAKGLPFHNGETSLSKIHRDDNGEITSIQLGQDYNHDGDSEFSRVGAPDDARTQRPKPFQDAERLWLALTGEMDLPTPEGC